MISLLITAEIFEKNGDFTAAEEASERFLSVWSEPDSLGQEALIRAQTQLERLQKGQIE